MTISKLNPHGYCGGVTNALNKAKNALGNPNTKKPIYMIGKIIHNDIVCKTLEKEGIIILNSNDKFNAINVIKSGTIIFTAHGIDDKLIEKATFQGLDVIDTTCNKVRIIKENIKKNITSHSIIYIGVKNHPECEAVLSISENIILVTCLEDLFSLDKNQKYYVTNQTTLSLLKIDELYKYISSNFSDVLIDNKICLATTQRQQAVLDCTADCIIIVGDKQSSNTKELYNISCTKCPSFLVSECSELFDIDLSSFSDIKITSGASTPEYLVDEIIEYISNTY